MSSEETTTTPAAAPPAAGRKTGKEAQTKPSTCSACNGPTPWVEDDNNPHAHEANGKICEECGHFYGFPPFQGGRERYDELMPLLFAWCEDYNWEFATKRLQYTPEEATFVGRNGNTALNVAIDSAMGGVEDQAPIDLIAALAKAANPESLIGQNGAILCCISWGFNDNRAYQICKIILNLNMDALLEVHPVALFGSGPKISLLATILFRADHHFLEATTSGTTTTPPEQVLDNLDNYTGTIPGGPINARTITGKGELRRMFNLCSMLVKACYYGKVMSDNHLLLENENDESLLHAIAGCRDPFFTHIGFPLLAAKLLPQQLLQRDETRDDGNYPLHIVVSTINREQKEYRNFVSLSPAEERERNKYRKQKYAKLFRKEGFVGSQKKLMAMIDYYDTKMSDKHRLDKKAVIEAFVQESPQCASLRNSLGQLPIHLALGLGKKQWDGGVQAIAEAYPEGIGLVDPISNLFPFMASAVSNDLDTTYELLRFRPEVLTWRSLLDGDKKLPSCSNNRTGKRRRLVDWDEVIKQAKSSHQSSHPSSPGL